MINEIVNCNAMKMQDGSKWVTWFLDQKKSIPQKNLYAIVRILNRATLI